SDPELHAEFLFDQLAGNLSCPQPEVEAVLARVLAVDPAKHLPFLRRCQRPRPPRRLTCGECAQALASSARRAQPLVYRGATKPGRSDHRAGVVTVAHP